MFAKWQDAGLQNMGAQVAELTDLHRAKRGVVILTTCVVQTLNEPDLTFQERFQKKLEDAPQATR
jgi:hypothetical protein